MGLQDFVDTAAPALSTTEEIYLQSLIELTRSQLGEQPCVISTTLCAPLTLGVYSAVI